MRLGLRCERSGETEGSWWSEWTRVFLLAFDAWKTWAEEDATKTIFRGEIEKVGGRGGSKLRWTQVRVSRKGD